MGANEAQFNAVKMMREIRDKLSQELEGMSFEEEKEYIKKHVNIPIPQTVERKRQSA